MMKRFSICGLTAAVMMLQAVPVTAYGAVNTYEILGGRGKVMIVGNGSLDCQTGILDHLSGSIPGINIPGVHVPEQPDHNRPDHNRPEQNRPENPLPEQPGENSDTSVERQVVDLVNEERAKAGLGPLTVNPQAMRAADVRAREIVSSFSHSRPDGSSFSTALKEAGVDYRASGENIAYGQRTAEEVMNGWMNSSGHRANILNGSFTSIGVGHYQSNGVDYWVQLFVD